jgi:hypothetical protein
MGKAKLVALLLLIKRVLAMVAVASDPIFHLLLSKKWGQAALLGIG